VRPFQLLQLLLPVPGGAGLFRLLMRASFACRGAWADLLSRLTSWPGAPAWLLRWAVQRRERLLLAWHRDLSDLRHLGAVLTSR